MMRCVAGFLALAVALFSQPGFTNDKNSTQLLGSWRLISFQIMAVGEEAPTKEVFGPHPFGRLIMTPEHYMAAYLARPDRKLPTNETETAALVSSMIAYTGKFRVEGDKFITTVDGAWNEIYKANEQVRFFVLDGDKLSIRTAEAPSGVLPGKRVVGTLVWERER